MRAITQHTYGTADILTLEDVPTPDVGATDVRIRVRNDNPIWPHCADLIWPHLG